MTLGTASAVETTLGELLSDGLFTDGDWVESKDQDPNGRVRLIQLADIGDGVFRNQSSRFLTLAKARNLGCTFLEPGDVLVARMPEPLGRACIFPGVNQPAVTAVDVCVLRPNPARVRTEWLVEAINSPFFRSSMQQLIRGTTRQRISRKNLATLPLAVPPVPEQLALATALEELHRTRESAAAHLSVARTAIRRFRQAVLAKACSGHLTSEWREQNAERLLPLDVRRLGEARRHEQDPRYREPDLNPHASREDLPESWGLVPLGLLLHSVKYGTSRKSEYGVKGSPVLRIPNVSGERFDVTDLKFAALDKREASDLALQTEDLLMVRSNGSVELVGRALVVPDVAVGMAYAGYLLRLRPDKSAVHPAYLQIVLASRPVRDQIELPARSTSGVHNINSGEVRSLGIPLPPYPEQEEIARRVERLAAVANRISARIEVASGHVGRSSQSVLAKSFRGELSQNGAKETNG